MVQILVIEYFHCCLLISLIIFYLRLHFMFDKRGGSWRLESNDIRFWVILFCFVFKSCLKFSTKTKEPKVFNNI